MLTYPHPLNSCTNANCVPHYYSIFDLLTPIQLTFETAWTSVLTMQSAHNSEGSWWKAPLYSGQHVSIWPDAKMLWLPATITCCCQHNSYLVTICGSGVYRQTCAHPKECHINVFYVCALHIGQQASSIFFGNLQLTQHPPTGPQPVVRLLWMLHTMFCMACLYSSSLLVISTSLPSWRGAGLACKVCDLPAAFCAPSLWVQACIACSFAICLHLWPYPSIWHPVSYVNSSAETHWTFCDSQCHFMCFTGISGNWGDEGVVQMDLGPETNCWHWPDQA